ncbi:Acyl-CoA dehydrogenase C-terminal domain-containing protein [Duncaniella dubosii]|uniref:Acyl-CoA dehydrogenase C-terminal domain-containing protein n=1 Tax=Duncaniella dubosii TaxID=2518971 RepID=UPI003F6753D9
MKPELQGLKDRLVGHDPALSKAVETVTAVDDSAYGDFMARRLVEMAGVIVMVISFFFRCKPQ